jgi:hypothetical protein
MKLKRNIGQNSIHAKTEFYNEESHQLKDDPTISDKT